MARGGRGAGAGRARGSRAESSRQRDRGPELLRGVGSGHRDRSSASQDPGSGALEAQQAGRQPLAWTLPGCTRRAGVRPGARTLCSGAALRNARGGVGGGRGELRERRVPWSLTLRAVGGERQVLPRPSVTTGMNRTGLSSPFGILVLRTLSVGGNQI